MALAPDDEYETDFPSDSGFSQNPSRIGAAVSALPLYIGHQHQHNNDHNPAAVSSAGCHCNRFPGRGGGAARFASPMAGEGGQVKRRTVKSVTATAGEGHPMTGRSPTAMPAKPEEAAAPKNRMPEDHVKWILAQKPMAPPPRYAALKRSNPGLAPPPGAELGEGERRLYFLARAFYEMEERLPEEQEWVREELRTKGFVEVSDEWLQRKAEVHALLDREWPRIQAKLEAIILKDKETDQCDAHEDDCYEDDED